MHNSNPLPRPVTLISGSQYRLRRRDGTTGEPRLISVTFLAYTASPAFVVVSAQDERMRCSRPDLFDLAGTARSVEWRRTSLAGPRKDVPFGYTHHAGRVAKRMLYPFGVSRPTRCVR
jgi:hypothetical protein